MPDAYRFVTDVNVTELRQRLQHYLDRARRGEAIRVSSRGRVIAQLTPAPGTADGAAAARRLLRGSVVRFGDPLEPVVASDEWDVNR